MKLHILLMNSILLFLNTSCIHQNKNSGKKLTSDAKQQKIEKIQLTEQTRGFNESVVFTPTSKTTVSNERERAS